jgi:hypothetical protein
MTAPGIGTVHCILAYLFNTTVLTLLINIGAALFCNLLQHHSDF